MDAHEITSIASAVAVIIAALTSAWISIQNSKAAREDAAAGRAASAKAEAAALATHVVAVDTAKKVDGQTARLIEAVSIQKFAQGHIEGVEHEQDRVVAQKLAAASTGDRRAPAAPVEAVDASPVPVRVVAATPVPVVEQGK